jgi:rSAM/selenodomain-associated transferase 2
MGTPPAISVVIPTLNEAGLLPETLRRVQSVPEVGEIILVDGGSNDDTRDIARNHDCILIETKPSRGHQLRLGANQATGKIILLLHADTWLPENAGSAIIECLGKPLVVAGGFHKTFRAGREYIPFSRLRLEFFCRVMKGIYGDQGIFVRREILEAVGGVPGIQLMEEFELCKKLSAHGRLALAKATVQTSSRKFAQEGVLKTYWRMTVCTIRYWLGASPKKLVEIYYPKKGK